MVKKRFQIPDYDVDIYLDFTPEPGSEDEDEEDLSMYLPADSRIPESCMQGWKLDSRIAAGTFGVTYEACMKEDCKYVVKIIPLFGKIRQDIVTEIDEDALKEEIEIATFMGERGLGPKIYDSWKCNGLLGREKGPFGFVVMDKLDITLRDWVDQYSDLRLAEDRQEILSRWNAIKKVLFKKLKTLHKLGYVHNDLHDANIMFELDEHDGKIVDVFIIDWGRTFMSEDKNDFKDEMRDLEEISLKVEETLKKKKKR
jgi:serine/threonine protein kinase